MKRLSLFHTVIFIYALWTCGCVASFEPEVHSLGELRSGLPTSKEVKSGLAVSVEEFVSANKSRHVFDADVAAHGILPLLVRVENHSTEPYIVQRDQIRASLDGQALLPIYGKEAARQGAARNNVGRALVNTILWGPLAPYFGLPSMVASASHTRSVNKDIERHFEKMEFIDTVLKPGETSEGFAFFQLPGHEKRLEKLQVNVFAVAGATLGQEGREMTYRLSFPALEVSQIAFRRPRGQTKVADGVTPGRNPSPSHQGDNSSDNRFIQTQARSLLRVDGATGSDRSEKAEFPERN